MKKTIVRIVCFILILGVVLGYVNKVLSFKNRPIIGTVNFNKLKNDTVDVLFIGSSHAFVFFNTGTLWDEYGIASFVLSGSSQPMWNSYYQLKEALKTQTPKVIVLEGLFLTQDREYASDLATIESTFGFYRPVDKINSVIVSVPEGRRTEFLLEYMQYHTRYTELSASDFFSNQELYEHDDYKGFYPLMNTSYVEQSDIRGITERAVLHEKTEQYYRATIELAQMNSIPIVVVVNPYAGISEYEQQKFNTGSDIAAEYGIPFLNFNLLCGEIGIDFSTDAAESSHLNYIGSQKISNFIGSYLKENYDISDRRGDPAYESWQRNAVYIAQMIEDQILKETYDIPKIAEKLQNPNYWLFISVDGSCTTSDENLQEFFSTLGLPVDGSGGIGYYDTDGWEWYSQTEETARYISVEHDFCMRRTANDNGTYTNTIIIDNAQYQKVSNGINIVVYDTLAEKVADAIGINLDDEYNIIR